MNRLWALLVALFAGGIGNGVAGIVFGWTFRRRAGLEGARVAHGAADVWLQAAFPALLS
jgi:hypothetical protein